MDGPRNGRSTALAIGATLAHFRISDRLGAGGMGEVCRAEDTRLGRQVALKILPEAWGGDPERVARFEREASVLASLSHPNIATIHEVRGRRRFGSEDAVTFVGRYSARFTPPGEVRTGSFSNTWVRQRDGSWKIRASVTETGPEAPPAQPSNRFQKGASWS